MLLTLNGLQALGKQLSEARANSPGGRLHHKPEHPDFSRFEGSGLFCMTEFKTRPNGDPPSVHGRSQLGIDPETHMVQCVACERGL